MRFGLPQPLERPSPERIIREVPMDYPQQSFGAPPTPPQPEPSGLGILPTLLTAAAQLAGSPGAANMLKTAGALAGSMGAAKPSAPPPSQPQQLQERPRKRRPTTRVEKAGPPVRHRKPVPPRPAEPISDSDDFGWEGETPPMRKGRSGSEEFNFGLDGTSTVPINPFGGMGNPEDSPFGSQDDFGDMNMEDFGDMNMGGMGEDVDFNEEVELPDDFPDLNGMSADEMKQTVIDWINADPDNRKSQIMAMLPELSSMIM